MFKINKIKEVSLHAKESLLMVKFKRKYKLKTNIKKKGFVEFAK